MRLEGFVDYWAHRIARHPANSADAAAASVRMSEALDAEIGYGDTPERAEIIARLRAEAARIRAADRFMDGYDDPWGPAGRYGRCYATPVPVRKWTDLSPHSGRLDDYINQMLSAKKYGRSPVETAMPDQVWFDEYPCDFNPEGEKQMDKIDWHKPLRALWSDGSPQDGKVYTYKSGKQRVVWIDDRVYPVDDKGCAVAEVWYEGDRYAKVKRGALKGQRIVENVPEEKFFVGLARSHGGAYWLTDGGMPTTKAVLECWALCVRDEPHWIVDTRQSALIPEPVKHDPKDWTVVRVYDCDGQTESFGMMTEADAIQRSVRVGGTVVRVRTTPAPADTARYIQLYRRAGSNGPWAINAFPGPRQEYTWKEADKKNGYNEYVNVKVRD